MPSPTPDNAGVRIPPPFIYAVPLIVAWLLRGRWPLPFSTTTVGLPTLGRSLIILGVVCALPAFIAFLAVKTSFVPIRPSSHLVTTGIYRRTRNPMYLGFAIAYVGVAVLLWTWWSVLFLPFVIWAMNDYVIAREERYLDSRFGEAYREYRRKVRRWI